MTAQIPESKLERIVILGAGFGGMRLATKLAKLAYQVVLIDKNNFHQFQPLFYQVATSGLAPSSIVFPIRKAFHGNKNLHFRMAEIQSINKDLKVVETSVGQIRYDQLVIALGADTNYFNNSNVANHAFPMKSVQESLTLRNHLLECIELALVSNDAELKAALMNVVIVGGGPTGTEVAGALSEMKRYVLPKDYPELDFSEMKIELLEGGKQLLNGMSEASSSQAKRFLERMGVVVQLNSIVQDYDGLNVKLKEGEVIKSKTLIWAAGVKANMLKGLGEQCIAPNGRIKVNAFNQVEHSNNIYAIGDISLLEEKGFEKGHPQVAQVAIQQADNVARNFKNQPNGSDLQPFRYKDLGSMATVGRNKAVVDLPYLKFQGFFAWLFWLFVHLMAILGVRNKFFIFMEWLWNYVTFDQSLRLVIKQKPDHALNRNRADN